MYFTIIYKCTVDGIFLSSGVLYSLSLSRLPSLNDKYQTWVKYKSRIGIRQGKKMSSKMYYLCLV